MNRLLLIAPRTALAMWLAGWIAMGILLGEPVAGWWLPHLPAAAHLAVSFVPLLVLLATTLAVASALWRAELTNRTMGLWAVLAITSLAGAAVILPASIRLAIQGPMLLLLGMVVGVAIARAIKEPAWILPVVTVLAMVDAGSVLAGPTKAVFESEKGRQAAEYVMVTYPSAAASGASFGASMYFGLPDAVVFALLLGLAIRFRLRLAATGWSLAIGMLVALVIAGGFGIGIPALPYLCGAFVIANVRELERDPKSMRELGVFLAVLVGLWAAVKVLR